MPLCTVTTNLSKQDIPKDFHLQMNQQIAKLLNKPVERCVTMIYPDTFMAKGDTTDKTVVVNIQSYEVFDPETNPKYAAPFRDFINKSLNMTDDRVALILFPLQKWQAAVRP